MNILMKTGCLVALIGSILTLVQIFLLASAWEPICFNDGCKVVDSLTTVPPLLINLGGLLFFQTIFWGIWFSGARGRGIPFVRIVLLAGLAAEGVLLAFQHLVAQTFCSYCLIILSLVVLLNLLFGLRHLLAGMAVFSAVLIAFASLKFSPDGVKLQHLDEGSFAAQAEEEKGERRYLFFSSACPHCEEVIASLASVSGCTVRFNPIDEITDFALEKAARTPSYRPEVNLSLMHSLGLKQVPVLLVQRASGFQIIKGSRYIQNYLDEVCRHPEVVPEQSSTYSPFSAFDFLPSQNEGCSIDTECEESLVPEK